MGQGFNGLSAILETSMTDIWMYLLFFWIGLMMGFGLFAMLQVSREEDERPVPLSDEHRFPVGC
jgi:hypothetical protein